MRRRAFFSALVGAPVTLPAKQEPTTVTVRHHGMTCAACGMEMYCHRVWQVDYSYFTCCHPGCPQHDVPVVPPVLKVDRADPQQVARIRAEEEKKSAIERRARELHDAIVEDPQKWHLLATADPEVQSYIRYQYGWGF
jgi:hypothetical protein